MLLGFVNDMVARAESVSDFVFHPNCVALILLHIGEPALAFGQRFPVGK